MIRVTLIWWRPLKVEEAMSYFISVIILTLVLSVVASFNYNNEYTQKTRLDKKLK